MKETMPSRKERPSQKEWDEVTNQILSDAKKERAVDRVMDDFFSRKKVFFLRVGGKDGGWKRIVTMKRAEVPGALSLVLEGREDQEVIYPAEKFLKQQEAAADAGLTDGLDLAGES